MGDKRSGLTSFSILLILSILSISLSDGSDRARKFSDYCLKSISFAFGGAVRRPTG